MFERCLLLKISVSGFLIFMSLEVVRNVLESLHIINLQQ